MSRTPRDPVDGDPGELDPDYRKEGRDQEREHGRRHRPVESARARQVTDKFLGQILRLVLVDLARADLLRDH